LEKHQWLKSHEAAEENKDEFVELTLAQIFLGEVNGFKGLIPLMRELIDIKEFTVPQKLNIERYFKLIEGRVKGEIMTGAAFIRKIVINHPQYKKDSIVSEVSFIFLISFSQFVMTLSERLHCWERMLSGTKNSWAKHGGNFNNTLSTPVRPCNSEHLKVSMRIILNTS